MCSIAPALKLWNQLPMYPISPLYQPRPELIVQMADVVPHHRNTPSPVPGSPACLSPRYPPTPFVDPTSQGGTSTTTSFHLADFVRSLPFRVSVR